MNACVVSFEQLPVGFLGCYGSTWAVTPNLDRFATESIVFDQHFGENFDPSAANSAWWTGRYQFLRTHAQQVEETSVLDLLRAGDVDVALLRFESHNDVDFTKLGKVLDAWNEHPTGKHLLWLQFRGPHFRDVDDSSEAIADYLHQVAGIDADLGTLLSQIDTLQIPPPVVIVTAGAGERILTRDEDEMAPHEAPLHEERVHVPLSIRLPGSNQAGSRRQALTQSVDIAPTLTDWLGVETDYCHLEGQSLLPVIHGQVSSIREHAFLGAGTSHSVRSGDFCLIRDASVPPQLFLKPEDRYEQADAAREYPDVVEEFESLLDEFLAAHASA